LLAWALLRWGILKLPDLLLETNHLSEYFSKFFFCEYRFSHGHFQLGVPVLNQPSVICPPPEQNRAKGDEKQGASETKLE